jgi:DNA polymerase I-like protein with 3'-5' exonuclease and polymerase domains
LLYGAGPKTLQKQAKVNHRTNITLDEATHMYKTFHETFAGLKRFERSTIQFAKHYGFVINPFGYMSRLPLINSFNKLVARKMEQKATNRIIQSTGSNLLMLALNLIHKHLPHVKLCGSVHDSGLAYIRKDKLEDTLPQLKHIVEHLPLQELFKCDMYEHIQLPCDIEVGENLGNLSPWSPL